MVELVCYLSRPFLLGVRARQEGRVYHLGRASLFHPSHHEGPSIPRNPSNTVISSRVEGNITSCYEGQASAYCVSPEFILRVPTKLVRVVRDFILIS